MSSSPTFAPHPVGRGERLRVAAVQMNSGPDKAANVASALALIDQAAASGARLVALPEVWSYLGPEAGNRANAETVPGPTIDRLADRARRHGIYLHAGSVHEIEAGDPRLFNTTAVIDPDGNIVARYRKIHMFDIALDGVATYQESETVSPGDDIVVVDVDGMAVGLAICYDLRFPELFRILALRGAEAIVLPAAFTMTTGKDHWEVLIRARAIENGVFVVAPAQFGRHEPGKWCYGRSTIVDPWGTALATAPDAETVVTAELDRALLRQVRRQIPSLANRRPERYAWPRDEAALVAGSAPGLPAVR
ncbi:MAG: carbon-nitrogen hydrolase family protein [Chloroflexota bacterium]|nr:carbon-nitrogen hydrolase family protein [Chloroflexota bacterium]